MATTLGEVTPAEGAVQQDDAPSSGSPRPAAQPASAGWWRSVPPSVVVGGGITLFVAVVGLVGMLLVTQLNAINDSIGRLDTKIDNVAANLDAKIGRLDTKIDNVAANLDAKIGRLDTKIDNLETNLDAKIGRLDAKIDSVETNLRTEMQAGFAQINAVLLDHTDRLARLEAHAGLAAAPPPS